MCENFQRAMVCYDTKDEGGKLHFNVNLFVDDQFSHYFGGKIIVLHGKQKKHADTIFMSHHQQTNLFHQISQLLLLEKWKKRKIDPSLKFVKFATNERLFKGCKMTAPLRWYVTNAPTKWENYPQIVLMCSQLEVPNLHLHLHSLWTPNFGCSWNKVLPLDSKILTGNFMKYFCFLPNFLFHFSQR